MIIVGMAFCACLINAKDELQLVIALEENFYEPKKVQNIYTSDVGLTSGIFLPVLSLPTCQRT